MVAPNQIITPQLLTQLREIQKRMMPGMCQIVFPPVNDATNISDSGAPTEDADVADAILDSPCRVSPHAMGDEQDNTLQVQSIQMFAISLPWDVDATSSVKISENCQILFGGATYRILSVLMPRTMLTSTRCVCEKIT